ncbi:hypothetical protein CRM22_003412 [Opisthorchis felineus]|uniref:ATP-dependent RNA helicase YTHDC2 n=1 Tax=Opisthorchis felineus TaxID=147828 RepID=A0A4S2M197_OPIFE|nr:hypothetical protein CRM22_003412 [Opisthorchis felineus]
MWNLSEAENTDIVDLLMCGDLTHTIPEDVRLGILLAILQLVQKNKMSRLTFPESFNSTQRGFVRLVSQIIGLRTFTSGNGPMKMLTVYNPTAENSAVRTIHVSLSLNSKRAIMHLLQSNPLSARERLELNPGNEVQHTFDKGNREERQRGTTGRLMGAVPQVPPAPIAQTVLVADGFHAEGTQPTICNYSAEIIHLLNHNQVLVVFGPPGCGKTTYLPQVLLNDCHNRNQRCRMICTEPRRLYAHINAERIAHLRGETVGQTIGYQIRLESKVSPRTLLTFCTHGVLLRTIYADPGLIAGTTHILVDEVEEDEIPLHRNLISRNNVFSEPCQNSPNLSANATDCRDDDTHLHPSAISSKTEGCGILLGMLPWLLNHYPHLKVILLVNLRKTTFDSRRFELYNDIVQHTVEYQAQHGLEEQYTVETSVALEQSPQPFNTNCCECADQFSKSSGKLLNPLKFSTDTIASRKILFSPIRELEVPSALKSCASSLPSGQTTQQCMNLQSTDMKHAACLNLKTEHLSSWNLFYEKAQTLTIPYPDRHIATYYLEDILSWVGYWNANMHDASINLLQDESKCQVLASWLNETQFPSASLDRAVELGDNFVYLQRTGIPNPVFVNESNRQQLSPNKEFYYQTPESLSTNFVHDNLPAENVTPTSRQHAEKLIWSIWRCAVLRPARISSDPALSTPLPYIQELLTNLYQCLLAGWFPVDFQHSQSGLTALMVCCAAGLIDSVERLLSFGANVALRVPFPYEILQSLVPNDISHQLCGPRNRRIQIGNQVYLVVGVNAYDLAKLFGHQHVESILLIHIAAQSLRHIPEHHEAVLLRYGAWFSNPVNSSPFSTYDLKSANKSAVGVDNEATRNLLLTYHTSRNLREPETAVDFDLLRALLKKMDSNMPEGDILIFLPSYEEIITLRDQLLDMENLVWEKNKRYLVLILHSRMLVADLANLFLPTPPGSRKVILSTSIAEFSMSFARVASVIDCGLDCAKTRVDWGGALSLQNYWISRSTAIQRQTRIGVTSSAICFRLFSRIRYQCLGRHQSVSKSYPLEEACIQARLLTSPGLSVHTMLSVVPKPPTTKYCDMTVQALMDMDALSNPHELTELGYHTCDIPIPPRYAKMVLVSVALKCLDPILTIACILTYAEPFYAPKNAFERREWRNVRRKFASESYSDHMMLLRAFQFWQKARSEGWEKSFCQKNFISSAAFEIITVIRTQLLGQLRASGFVKARGSGDIRDLNTNSENWAVVKAAIVAGMHPQFAKIDEKRHITFITGQEGLVKLHPHSVLATADWNSSNSSCVPSEWLVYDQVVTLPQSKTEAVSDKRYGLTLSDGDKFRPQDERGIGSPVGHFTPHCRSAMCEDDLPSYAGVADSSKACDGLERLDEAENKFGQRWLRFIGCVTVVSPVTIALMAGPMRSRPEILRELETLNDPQINPFTGAKDMKSDNRRNQSALLRNPHTVFSYPILLENQDMGISESNPNSTQLGFRESENQSFVHNSGPKTVIECDPRTSESNLGSDSDSDEMWTREYERQNKNLRLGDPDGNLRQVRHFIGSGTKQASALAGSGVSSLCSETYTIHPSATLSLISHGRPIERVGHTSHVVSPVHCQPLTPGHANHISLRLDDRGLLHFRADSTTAQFIVALRQKWQALLLRRLRNPGRPSSPPDEIVLSVVVAVLTAEEHALGLRQPSGVGARPRPMATELCNQVDCFGDSRNARNGRQPHGSQTMFPSEVVMNM